MRNENENLSEEGFDSLGLDAKILRAIKEENYQTPTPIQLKSIPSLLQGRDLWGCAQTGTGKTAAFALPLLQRLAQNTKPRCRNSARALVLAPTRELAVQIEESFRVYGRHLNLNRTLVYGGVSPVRQIQALRRGVDILVATPGRLLDLFNQGYVNLDKVEIFVLDEADRMLDMGFLPDVRRIQSAIPANRQTMLFSATLPEEIRGLVETFLNDPVHVTVTPPASTVDRIDQRVLFVDRKDKGALLHSVLEDSTVQRALIFTRTKHGANKVAKSLVQGRVRAEVIHGNKSQSARQQALEKFRSGKARVLVATDVASRGLDVDDITHVINYELPNETESYVHRIGRTARAGAVGIAISFCDSGERSYLLRIQRDIARDLTVDATHSFHCSRTANSASRRNGSKGTNRSEKSATNGKAEAEASRKNRKPSRGWKPRRNSAKRKNRSRDSASSRSR